jgi:uncharacterized membrane protein
MRAFAAASDDAYEFARNDSSRARPFLVWFSVAALACLLLCLIVLAPLALAHGKFFLALSIYQGFSLACHQLPARSFFIENYPLAVCARCAGLYTGFAMSALVYPLARDVRKTIAPSRVWLILAVMPLAIDWALGFFGIWRNTHVSRFATGAFLGAVSVFYVMPGLVDLSRINLRSLRARFSSSNERSVHEL